MRSCFSFVGTLTLLIVTALLPAVALAHCDGMDGPVVKAANRALESGEVRLALPWVQPGAEREVREAFEKTMTVRGLSPQAKDLADRYFFETLVRLHRAGEGEPFTGLKPAGRDLGPAIPAADKAIETASATEVLQLLVATTRTGVERRLAGAIKARQAAAGSDDVELARRSVRAYVSFVHYVEQLYGAAAAAHDESEAASAQERHGEH
jgi:hypothetical protein